MRTVRVVAAAFLFGGLFPLAVAVPAACAAEGPSAALVVDTEVPGGQYRYCVALPDGSVTGIELIELASEQHGLQYRLGYGGNVVCQLAGVGYDSDECLKSGPEFWGYWRGNGSGGWDWSSTGGHATTVTDGDVEGWSWGTGNDGASHPAPPDTTFVSVCGKPSGGGDGGDAEPKDPEPKGGGKAGRPKEGKASAATPSIEEQVKAAEEAAARRIQNRNKARGDRKQKRTKEREKKSLPRPARSSTPSPVASSPTPSATPTSAPGEGPPAGGLLATGAVALCIGGAVFLQRRRVRAR